MQYFTPPPHAGKTESAASIGLAKVDERNVVSSHEILTPENFNVNRKTRTRINWVDAGKCIGILMVMFGHNWLHPRYCYYFYAFHMPLFFVLSGYTFSARQKFPQFLLKKGKALLIPYITFALVCSMFYLCLNFAHTGHFHFGGMSEKYLLRGTETFLWFLPTLFLSEILTYALYKCRAISALNKCISSVVILFLCGFTCSEFFEIDYNTLGILRIVPQATAFVLTGFVYRHYLEGFRLEKSWIFIITVVIVSIGLATLNYTSHSSTTMFNPGNYLLFVITAIIATYGLMLILKKISFPKWFLYIGISSIIFYGLHRLVIEACFISYGYVGIEFDKVSFQSLSLAILNVLIACLIIYPVSKIIDRHAPWLIGKF